MSLFKLTRKSSYALVLLTLLARKTKGERISLSEMEALGLPKAFMAQIAKDLVEGGVLVSKEGRGGGYALMNEPGEITVREALEAVAGEILAVDCNGCEASGSCRQKSFMANFADEIGEILENYTLIDLIN
ncbi:Rrf2 family transcriptional regulator [Patescibacteria group bacterium]|nr:Rrf2 family transcriptional regulator [Patescibacteria group bacterium]